jgi:phosphatidylserine/phosphatidylglycerophosphate/cardiolipin synthase-like enzyme
MENQTIIGAEYPVKVGKLIETAKSSIDILMFDWRWYKDDMAHPLQIFNQKLVRAVRRGVRIRTITNYAELVDTLNILGFYAKKWPQKNLLHSKLVIIDKEIVVSGSHNFTGNAFCANLETSVIFHEPALAQKFTEYFENIWP